MRVAPAFLNLVSGALLLGGQTSFAQTEVQTGSHIPVPKPADISPDSRLSDENAARKVTYEFGQCVVLTYPKKISMVIELPEATAEQNKALMSIATSDCLRSGELTMPRNLMLGAIYRALYLRDFKKSQPPLLDKPYDDSSLLPGPGDNGRVLHILHAFADCVVRIDPSSSRALTLASPGDAAEHAAMTMIIPKLGPCMSHGLTAKFNRSSISALLAQGLYLESRAASMTLASGGSH